MKLRGSSLRAAVNWLMENKCGCSHWHLVTDDKGREWSIVVGWEDGFAENDDDIYKDGTWRICAKIAYQEPGTMMQTDYGIDFTMPYDEETYEVCDTSSYIGNITKLSDFNSLADYLDELFEKVVSDWAYFENEEEEIA